MVSFIKPSAAANMKQYLMPSYGEIMKHALTCKAIGAEVCSSVWCEFVLVKINMNQLGVILYLNMYVCKFEPIQHVFRQKAFCKESILFHSYTLFYSLQRGQGIFIAINYTHVFSGDPINLFTLNSKWLILLARYQPFVVAFVWVIRAIAISQDSLFAASIIIISPIPYYIYMPLPACGHGWDGGRRCTFFSHY